MSNATDRTENELLRPIVGEQLSAVVFVQDYVQLQFDGPMLTAVTVPTVEVGQTELKWGMPGYRDALCERIGKIVRAASVSKGRGIRIEFEDGSAICVSLKSDDYRTAEAAIFDNGPKWWVL